MVGLALAAAAGASALHLGVPLPWTLLSLLFLLRPHPPSPRPALLLAFLAGGLLTHMDLRERARDCRYHLPEGQPLHLEGRLQGRVVGGRGEILPRGRGGTGGGECRQRLRFVIPEEAGRDRGPEDSPGKLLRPGRELILHGSWRRGRVDPGLPPLYAGYLRVDSVGPAAGRGTGGWPGAAFRLRGRVQERLGLLFPRQRALAEALVLARKEGLDRDVRDAFARAGTAHLLAISGFHVGVVAGLLLLLAGLPGLPHPLRFGAASLGVWAYVLGIGAPDAAVRAASILSVLALGRVLDRPVASMGALATAFLLFFVLDPGCLVRPGFQLSFAGALGLVLWARSTAGHLRRRAAFLPRALATGVAAGVSATLATLPLVAWHFGRVSLVGIPVTLLATPLVTLAIPGIFASLLLSLLHPALGGLVARGVELDLHLLGELVQWAADLPVAAAWVGRPAVVAGTVGCGMGLVLHRALPSSSGPSRRRVGALAVLGALLLAPVLSRVPAAGSMELIVFDVGQGDALAIRSPANRWLLVDAGPRTESFDAGARVVLPYLRRRGVSGLEALILTHPDMDHVGGSAAILQALPVETVADPGVAAGKEVFLRALEVAKAREVPWRILEAGDSLNLDGVAMRVVSPDTLLPDANASSLVLELRFGAFAALLTGDAPREREEVLLSRLLSPGIHVLKVGHHGSRTSTSPELLERIRPEVAIVSAGRRNRFGHPHPVVLELLREGGVKILRTDREGLVRIRARKDGTYGIRTSREGGPA